MCYSASTTYPKQDRGETNWSKRVSREIKIFWVCAYYLLPAGFLINLAETVPYIVNKGSVSQLDGLSPWEAISLCGNITSKLKKNGSSSIFNHVPEWHHWRCATFYSKGVLPRDFGRMSEGNTALGRPRHRWESNMKSNLNEIGWQVVY